MNASADASERAATGGPGDDSFPVLNARTARFTLGRPRGFAVSPDGARVAFLRSRGGTDRITCLWVYDVDRRRERLVADPVALLAARNGSGSASEELPDAEKARRERAREQAGGIVGYATDADVTVAAFALSGRLFAADLLEGNVRQLDVRGPAFDPRPDPAGRVVGYVSAGELRLVDLASGADRSLAREDGVTWGLAEFVAAEEMNRSRGYWWSPDGSAVLAARVDESPVQRWHIGDPANPATPPKVVAYPAAGTPNAIVSLALISVETGAQTPVLWDAEAFPYVVSARWGRGCAPLLQVATRDQRSMRVLDVDPASGLTSVVRDDRDDHWIEVVTGTPDRLADGRLVHTMDVDDTRRLAIDGVPVSPAALQVRAVHGVGADRVLFTASEEPTEQHLWSYSADGGCRPLTSAPGVHVGVRGGDVLVVSSASLDADGVTTVIRQGDTQTGVIPSMAEPAPFVPLVSISRQSSRELRTALVLPRDHVPGSRRLPVLMDPYGGPHAQRVVASRGAYLNAQWLADQGFAVVIVDGRGTPGRGPVWERAVAGDLAGPVLDDQIDALHSLATGSSDLDMTRVGIRGWSFGGYLAALAVLRRPDVFHAAVAGAPVTDWRLYDTFYTERYLGVEISDVAYERSSLIDDAPSLTRPLLLVHGLADDNVVAAHTLRFSSALLAAGRPHEVLPLSGVTHMTPQEHVAANLLQLEVAFFRRALGLS